jgi:2,4-dienoyl-CoA reductase (NADPH2)
MLRLSDDSYIPGLKRLTEAIHSEGCAVFPQLMHPGRYARSKEYGGQQAVAPSAVPSRFTGETPRELTCEEMQYLVCCFKDAALRAKKAGFDGVEITAASGYLLAQFLSPYTNRRTDRYGGSFEARLTFPLEVIEAVRGAVGPDFPVMVRVAGHDFMPGGNTWSECVQICRTFEEAGADAIDMTGGWHETNVPQLTMEVPHGAFSYIGRKIKEAISIPLVVCNRMAPQTAEKIVEDGIADFVGFARGFLADSDLAVKAQKGEYDSIRPCIACNQACMDHIFFGKQLNCLVNAEAGREWELMEKSMSPSLNKTADPKNILVIGAGPAGLEYARVAAMRGHKVTVWEAEQPGGQLRMATQVYGRQEFQKFIDYLLNACRRLNVEIVTGKKAEAGEIAETAGKGLFDKVVIATGKKPGNLDIDTDGSIPVVNAWDVLKGTVSTGKRIVVAGGSNMGVQAAMKLSESGVIDEKTLKFLMLYRVESEEELYGLITKGNKKITVVEEGKGIGKDIGPSTRWAMLGRLKQFGVETVDQARITGIKEGNVLIKEAGGGLKSIPADMVVIAAGYRPENLLYQQLAGSIGGLSVIGDAREPGSLLSAVKNAFEEALAV